MENRSCGVKELRSRNCGVTELLGSMELGWSCGVEWRSGVGGGPELRWRSRVGVEEWRSGGAEEHSTRKPRKRVFKLEKWVDVNFSVH